MLGEISTLVDKVSCLAYMCSALVSDNMLNLFLEAL